MNHTQPIVISNTEELPDRLFSGYAFVGSDLIFGSSGARDFEDHHGDFIGGGHDGCYISCWRHAGALEVTTDYSGYKKIFYYWSQDYWVVSDSFVAIVASLRENGVRIRPRYASLASAGYGGMAMSQVMSHYTAVEGVKIAPLHRRLRISDRGVELDAQGATSEGRHEGEPASSYRELLQRHVSAWVARFQYFLATPGLQLSFDLTGGLDSRVNFAMFLAAKERLEPNRIVSVPRINCGVTSDGRDLEVAEAVTSHFDVELNGPRTKPRRRLNGEQRFQRWREVCLGTYYPIYFPSAEMTPDEIFLGGGAAGNQRPVYERHLREASVDRFVQAHVNRVETEIFRPELTADLQEFFSSLPSNRSDTQKLIEHYRFFRGRMHSGRSAQYRVQFTPFGSSSLDAAYSALNEERVQTVQLNYDMMASLAPDLLEIEFDKKRKNPSRRVRELLTLVDIDESHTGGRFWGDRPEIEEAPTSPTSETVDSEFNHLVAAYELALQDTFVSKFYSGGILARADEAIDHLQENGKFSHPSKGAPVSAVLLAAEVSPKRELT